jgi:hypothetical protein
MPKTAQPWSLTSLREKLIKIGAKVVSHGRYVTFQMAEVAVPRQMFADVLSLIARLRAPPARMTSAGPDATATREEVRLDAAKTARSAPQYRQVSGSPPCRALRAAFCLAQDVGRADPSSKTAGYLANVG